MRWIEEAIQTGRDYQASSDRLLSVATVSRNIEKQRVEAEEQRRKKEEGEICWVCMYDGWIAGPHNSVLQPRANVLEKKEPPPHTHEETQEKDPFFSAIAVLKMYTQCMQSTHTNTHAPTHTISYDKYLEWVLYVSTKQESSKWMAALFLIWLLV